MASPIPYSDLGKTLKDLLTGGYALKNTVTVKTSVAGLDTKAKAELKTNFALEGNVETKYSTGDLSVTGTVNSDLLIKAVADYKGLGNGVTLKGAVDSDSNTSVSAKYAHPHVIADATVKVGDSTTVKAASLFSVEFHRVGAQVEYDVTDDKVKSWEFGGSTHVGDNTGVVARLVNATTIHLGALTCPTQASKLGADVSYDTKSEATSLTVGGQYNFPDVGTVKAKVTSAGVFSASLNRAITDNASITAATQISGTTFAAEDIRAGVGLSIAL